MNPASLFSYFSELKDPRDLSKTNHHLRDIVTIAICAVISGADGWNEVESYGEAKKDWLSTFLDLPNGIPSHDTFRRVFMLMNPDKFEACFSSWVASVFDESQFKNVNIDGKALRRSFDSSEGKSAIHIVSAWAKDQNVTLGQIKVDEKSNEITAIPKLLDMLSIDSSVVTIDAMGCQKEIAQKIIDSSADYILALKGNQKSSYTLAKQYFKDHIEKNQSLDDQSFYDAFDKSHGRLVRRRVWSIDAPEPITSKEDWKGLKSIIVVEAIRGVKSSNGHCKKVENHWRYYLSSLEPNGLKAANLVRGHWDIENNLHWTLDIAFREDECRKRKGNSSENFAVLRRIALNLLKQDKKLKQGIKAKRQRAGWDNQYLLHLLHG